MFAALVVAFVAAACATTVDAAFPIVRNLGARRETVLPNRSIHVEHTVRHRTSEGQFIHLDVSAVHDPKWVFLPLDDDASRFLTHVTCPVDQVIIADATAALIETVTTKVQGKEEDVVLVAEAYRHCGNKAMFRRVNAASIKTESDGKKTVTFSTANTTYHDVFEHAHVVLKTNIHKFRSQENLDEPEVAQVTDAEEGQSHGAKLARRGMSAQGWWHHITHVIHHVCHRIAHGAKHVWHTVKHIAKTAGAVAKFAVTGDYSKDATYTMDRGQYSKEVSYQDFNLRISGEFSLVTHFEIHIHHYDLRSTLATLTGSAGAQMTAVFDARERPEGRANWVTRLTTLYIHEICFSIGPIPVIIRPVIPVDGGVEASIATDGRIVIAAAFAETQSLTYGFRYEGGFHKIVEHRHLWAHDVTKTPFKIYGSVYPFIRPGVFLEIDFIGGPSVAATAGAMVTYYGDDYASCALYAKVNTLVSVAMQAVVDIHWHRIKFYRHQWGPYSLYEHQWPMYDGCLVRGSSARAQHAAVAGRGVKQLTATSTGSAGATGASLVEAQAFRGDDTQSMEIPTGCRVGPSSVVSRTVSAVVYNVSARAVELHVMQSTTTRDGSSHSQTVRYETAPPVGLTSAAGAAPVPVVLTILPDTEWHSSSNESSLPSFPAKLVGALSADAKRLALTSEDMCVEYQFSAPASVDAVAGSANEVPVTSKPAASTDEEDDDRKITGNPFFYATIGAVALGVVVAAAVGVVMHRRASAKYFPSDAVMLEGVGAHGAGAGAPMNITAEEGAPAVVLPNVPRMEHSSAHHFVGVA